MSTYESAPSRNDHQPFTEPVFSELEEMRMDHLMDDGFPVSRVDAEKIILAERTAQKMAQHTIAEALDLDTPKPSVHESHTHHYSHRGGRSFPEPSDSEGDPHWNVPTNESLSDEQRINLAALAHQAHEDFVVRKVGEGMSEVQARAILVARSQRR